MSTQALTWAFEVDLETRPKFVLVALANYADEVGECFPSQELIARMTGQSSRSVRTQLAALEESGWVSRKPRYGRDGKRTSDRYTIALDRATTGSVNPAPERATTGSNGHDYRKDMPSTTGSGLPRIPREPKREPSTPTSPAESPSERLAVRLAELLKESDPQHRERTGTAKWAADFDRMLRLDSRPFDETFALLEWACRHPFWSPNIRSAVKFCEKYETLFLQRERDAVGVESKVVQAGRAAAAQLAELEIPRLDIPRIPMLAEGGTVSGLSLVGPSGISISVHNPPTYQSREAALAAGLLSGRRAASS